MDEEHAIFGLLFLGGGAFAIWRLLQPAAIADPLPGGDAGNVLPAADSQNNQIDPFNGSSPVSTIMDTIKGWITPSNGQIYEATFKSAEAAYGLPDGLLSRVAYQESRYNPNAKSPVGALGLMQFMPATAAGLGFDPLDPTASIWGAAKYLKTLYGQFGDWTQALAAYNWGPGNVARKGLANAPVETTNYFTQILTDLGLPAAIG